VMLQASELGNAHPPAALNDADKARVTQLYHDSFIDAYGKILRIGGVLALLGGLMAVLFIRNKDVRAKHQSAEIAV